MKKGIIYFLPTCSTCKTIIRDVGITIEDFEMQDIKTKPISIAQLTFIKKVAGSYEAVFSRRCMKYKEWDLKDKHLEEADFLHYILLDYTFLKRPVVVIGNQIFAGSEKKNIEALKKAVKQFVKNE